MSRASSLDRVSLTLGALGMTVRGVSIWRQAVAARRRVRARAEPVFLIISMGFPPGSEPPLYGTTGRRKAPGIDVSPFEARVGDCGGDDRMTWHSPRERRVIPPTAC